MDPISFLAFLVISIAVAVLTPRPKIQNPAAATLGDVQLPTATEDRAMPVVWGTCRIAPNVTWRGDFKAVAATHDVSTGFFSSTTVTDGYRYLIGMQMVLCQEPIDQLIAIYSDKRLVWNTGLTVDKTSVNTFTVGDTWSTPGATLSEGLGAICELIAQPRLTNQNDFAYPVVADTTSLVSPYLTTLIGSAGTPAHRGVSYIVWRGPSAGSIQELDGSNPLNPFVTSEGVQTSGWIGNSPTPAPLYFVVKRLPNVSSLLLPYYYQVATAATSDGHATISDTGSGSGSSTVTSSTAQSALSSIVSSTMDLNGDANPAWVLYETLTNTEWGAGIWPGFIDAASFIASAQTLANEDNGLSMAWQESQPVSTIVDIICKQSSGVLSRDPHSGLFQFTLMRETDAVKASIDDSSIIELSSFGRVTLDDAVNQVKIAFSDRENDFQARVVLASNPALQASAGALIVNETQYEGCSRASVAATLALRDLQAVSQPLAILSLRTTLPAGTVLRQGDAVSVSWPPLGITGMRCRVTAATYERTISTVQLDLVQDSFFAASGFYSTSLTPIGSTGGPPVPITSQPVFLAPSQLNGYSEGNYLMNVCLPPASLTTTGYKLRWMDSNSPNVLRVAGNSDYGLGAAGVLTSDILATTNLTSLALTVDSYSAAVLVQNPSGYGVIGDPMGLGYQEWIYYGGVTISGLTATLTGLVRGIFDTFPLAASAATSVYLLCDYGVDNRPMQARYDHGGESLLDWDGYASVQVFAQAKGPHGLVAATSTSTVSITAGAFRPQLPRYPANIRLAGSLGVDATTGAGASISSARVNQTPSFTLAYIPRSRAERLPALGGFFDTTQTPNADADSQLEITITPIDPTTGATYPAVLSTTVPMSQASLTFQLPGSSSSGTWRIPSGSGGAGVAGPLIFKLTVDAQRTYPDGTTLGTGGAWVKYFLWNGS